MSKIKIIVDEENISKENSLQARDDLKSLVNKAKSKFTTSIEVDSNVLTEKIEEAYKTFTNSIVNLPMINTSIKVESVEFSMGINSKGEVSILSSANYNIQSSSLIKIKVAFKD